MDLGEFQIPGNSDPNQKTSHLSLDIGGSLFFFFFVISFWPMYLIFLNQLYMLHATLDVSKKIQYY